MKVKGLNLVVLCFLAGLHSAGLAEHVKYDFNTFTTGSIAGQRGWKVSPNIKNSSVFSVFDELGATEAAGDKALVIQVSDRSLHLAGADGLRWLPGTTWTLDFDFRVGITSEEPVANKQVLTVFLGNSYLASKSRWTVQLEVEPEGTWKLIGALPGKRSVEGIEAPAIIERPQGDAISISDWLHFTLVTKKLEKPDSFESFVEIKNSSQKIIVSEHFKDAPVVDARTKAMWNLSRLYFGFEGTPRHLGLACIDNIEISTTK